MIATFDRGAGVDHQGLCPAQDLTSLVLELFVNLIPLNGVFDPWTNQLPRCQKGIQDCTREVLSVGSPERCGIGVRWMQVTAWHANRWNGSIGENSHYISTRPQGMVNSTTSVVKLPCGPLLSVSPMATFVRHSAGFIRLPSAGLNYTFLS